MAKRNLHTNIERNYTIGGAQLPDGEEQGEDIEISLEGFTETEMEDGSVEFEDPEQAEVEEPEVEFGDNLVKHISDESMQKISSNLLRMIDQDRASHEKWEENYKNGLELLGYNYEKKTEPFAGATGVTHPMLNEAVSQFQSQAYKELLPPGGPVRTQVIGDGTSDLEKQSERVKDYMNFQITQVMKEYDHEFDQMLFFLGLCGSAFKKIYRDPQLNRPVSKFVMAEDMLVPSNAVDLTMASRITHKIRIDPNELKKLEYNGFYEPPRDFEIKPHAHEKNDLEEKKETLSGVQKSGEDEDIIIYECHCFLNLEEFPDVSDEEGNPTHIKLPYIVTIAKDSRFVLSIYRNWREDDKLKEKKTYFVHYPFTPGLGFYGTGLIHHVGNLSRAATATLRQLIDAGTLANLPAGFKTRGLRITNDDQPLKPGEWRDVDTIGSGLRDSLLPLPYKEPSATLFTLLGFVVESAQKFIGTTDIGTGNLQNSEMPVGTTVALMERGSRIMSAVHKRLYNSMKLELALLADLFAEDPGEYPYHVKGNAKGLKAQDFDDRVDIAPVANPNIFSMSQRVNLATEQLRLAMAKPELHNEYEAFRRMYVALGVDNIEQVLPPPKEPTPMDPIRENGLAQLASAGRQQLRAFEDQDHESHIMIHLMFMKSKLLRGDPSVLMILQTHIFEHLSLQAEAMVKEKYPDKPQSEQDPSQMSAEEQAQSMKQDQTPDPDRSNEIAKISTELLQKYMAEEEKMMESVEMDPLIELKSKELDLFEKKQEMDNAVDKGKLQLDEEKAGDDKEIEMKKIKLTEELAILKAQNDAKLSRDKITSQEEMAVLKSQNENKKMQNNNDNQKKKKEDK